MISWFYIKYKKDYYKKLRSINKQFSNKNYNFVFGIGTTSFFLYNIDIRIDEVDFIFDINDNWIQYKYGLNFLSLYKLVELCLDHSDDKLIKYKMLSNIQQLIHINKLPVDFANEFRDDIKNKYIELWKTVTF